MLISIKNIKKLSFLGLDKPIMPFFLLINVKMLTIIGILAFMNRKFSCSTELSMKRVIVVYLGLIVVKTHVVLAAIYGLVMSSSI